MASSVHCRHRGGRVWLVIVGAKGKTSKEYLEIKKMAFKEPDLLHAILKNLADSIGDYANYQASCIVHIS